MDDRIKLKELELLRADALTRCRGRPNRSILTGRVKDGVLHTFHATKGARKRRISPPSTLAG